MGKNRKSKENRNVNMRFDNSVHELDDTTSVEGKLPFCKC